MEMRGWIVKVTKGKWEALKHDVEMYKEDYGKLSEFWDCYGSFMKGALCVDVDVVYRDTGDPKWLLCGDGYILGEDTGYGYTWKDNIPYDEADGFCFELDTSKTYEEMMSSMIDQIEAYIATYKRWQEAVERTDLVWTEDM